MLFRVAAAALSLLVIAGCGPDDNSAKKADTHSPAAVQAASVEGQKPPLGPLPRVAQPEHYRLALRIDPTKERFSGHAEIDVNFTQARKSIFLHGLDLHVTRAAVKVGGKMVSAVYKQVDPSGVATLTFAQAVPAGKATLVFDYDAPFNTSLSGLYKVTDAGEHYAFTQFEATDARRMFPSFDEPGFKTPFDVSVIAPDGDKVIANTPVVNDAGAGNGMTKWVFAPTKPLPTYLIALAVGPLDIVDGGDIPADAVRTRPIHLRGITKKGQGARIKYALSQTSAIVQQLEQYYGIAYPYQKLDVLAVPDFAAGAMENAGAVTFREQLMLMDDNAPLEQRRSSVSVQAHELAHQWFGDLVTPKWWDDIWLNESFATWMSAKIANAVKPKQEFERRTLGNAESVMRLDELPSARQVHNPVHTPDDLANAFDDITYSKGAAVLAMFENYVGAEAWQKGIHAYLEKYAFKNATADDFIGTIAQTTKHPEIVAAFHSFIDQAGIPLLTARTACENGKASAVVTQMQYAPIGISVAQGKWDVPYCVQSDGKKICHMVTPPQADIVLGSTCAKTLFPNANGAGYYHFAMPDAKWQTLIDRAPTMSPEDQYTLFHNVDAALRGNYATANDYFSTITALAPSVTWDLLYSSGGGGTFNLTDSLHDMRVTGVISGDALNELQAFIRKNFAPKMAKLGIAPKPGEPAADTLSRQYLAQLLVEEGNDTALISKLTTAAHVYLNSNGTKYGGMAPELLQEAMRAGVMAEGAPFVDELIDAMKQSDDEYFVKSVIYAVAGSDDPGSLKKLMDMSLTPDMRIGDIRYVWRYFEAEPFAQPILWDWFKTNFDALKTRLSAQGFSGAPNILRYGCDENAKMELDTFFRTKTAQLQGTARTLKQNEDRIDRCIAFKQAKTDEIATALNTMH